MRMSVRKNSNQIQSKGIFQNRSHQGNTYLQEFDLKEWLFKTFIKLIISLSIFLCILLIKNINTSPTNYFINQLDFRLNQEFKVTENYNKAKNAIVKLTKEGEKALAVVNVGSLSKAKFTFPMEGIIITYFEDMIDESNRSSKGIIIEGDVGENIISVQEGVVIETGYNQSSGNYIVIKHNGELLSVYKNIERGLVEKNQKVVAGETIGTNSGKLRFEVWNNKEPVDPLLYIDLGIRSM